MVRMDNLSRNVTEQIIVDHLKKYSKIKNPPKMVKLVHHSSDESKMGFAFVELASHDDAQKVIDNVHLTKLEGRKCWIDLCSDVDDRNESQRGKTSTVVLMNVHYEIDRDAITSLCEKYGNVMRVSLPKDKEGYPRCMAFVDTDSNESAERLFDNLHGVKLKNLTICACFKGRGGERGLGRGRGRGRLGQALKQSVLKKGKKGGARVNVRPSGSKSGGRSKLKSGSTAKKAGRTSNKGGRKKGVKTA